MQFVKTKMNGPYQSRKQILLETVFSSSQHKKRKMKTVSASPGRVWNLIFFPFFLGGYLYIKVKRLCNVMMMLSAYDVKKCLRYGTFTCKRIQS